MVVPPLLFVWGKSDPSSVGSWLGRQAMAMSGCQDGNRLHITNCRKLDAVESLLSSFLECDLPIFGIPGFQLSQSGDV
jgi:hypothetical protein